MKMNAFAALGLVLAATAPAVAETYVVPIYNPGSRVLILRVPGAHATGYGLGAGHFTVKVTLPEGVCTGTFKIHHINGVNVTYEGYNFCTGHGFTLARY